MRIALLSTTESVAAAAGDPRGFLNVAGRSVIRHQLECALALGCEKIACLAHGLPPQLVAIQHLAEAGGAQFQTISGTRALSGMVRAADEVLVFADGLLPDRALAERLLADRPAVLALPADEGIVAGFERIDREYAWAGLMLVHGSAVERLADLPPDADPAAGLLRIGLQAGTRIVTMPPGVLAEREWGLVHSQDDAAEFERIWLGRYVHSASFAAPALALADRAAAALITAPEGRISGSGAILGGSVVLGVMAGLAAWFWEPVAGLALLALASFLARTGISLRSIEALGQTVQSGSGKICQLLGGLIDVALILVAGLASPQQDRITAILAAGALVLTLRLGGRLPLRSWKIILEDRTILAISFSVTGYFGVNILFFQIVMVAAVLAFLVDLGRSKLTRT